MALNELRFYSDTLGRCVSALVILPEQTRTLIGMKSDGGAGREGVKTVYLLHGLSDDHSVWSRRSSIERYAAALGIAVVMPDAGRSWYTDMVYGGRYFTFLTHELPEKCRQWFAPITGRREESYIAGISMGGYGALKAAYTYPDRYAAAAALSGAFSVEKPEMRRMIDSERAWEAIFGQGCPVKGSENDLFALARHCSALPPTYLCCGEGDALLPCTEEMHALLLERGAVCEKRTVPGGHNWELWDREIVPALKWMLSAAE